ncbi:MAG: PKD domain-containing protein [Flavobacteriales bacterium]|nr:PKD domain-containing protein [Flavobacteriales bacterium]
MKTTVQSLLIFILLLTSLQSDSQSCSSFTWESDGSGGMNFTPLYPYFETFGGTPHWTFTTSGGSEINSYNTVGHLSSNQLNNIGLNGAVICFTWGEGNLDCFDTTCIAVIYYYQSGQLLPAEMLDCNASFESNIGENGSVEFTNTSTGGAENTVYTWSVGNEVITNQNETFNHTFTSSGQHLVCLTMSTYAGEQLICTSEYCEYINIEFQQVECAVGTYPVTVEIATCCEADYANFAVFSFWNEFQQVYFNGIDLMQIPNVGIQQFCIPEGCYTVQFDYSLMEQAAQQIEYISITSPNTTLFTEDELWQGLPWNLTMCLGPVSSCPDEIWSGAGDACGVMNFEIGSFVEGESVTWYPGDESGAVIGGHAFTHTYASPGSYNVCAYYTSPTCPDGVELCETIVVESCNNECPTQLFAYSSICGFYTFNVGNEQLGEVAWNFGDGNTSNGLPWAEHVYLENGEYVVTATYFGPNCPGGTTVSQTIVVDCIVVIPCPTEIWSGAGNSCGVMNFEIGSFIEGEQVTWFPGDETGAVVGGHFFSHTYAEPGSYNVCAFYTSPNCPEGVELCTTIVVESCPTECPSVLYGNPMECGTYSFNLDNFQLGEVTWNFGDGEIISSTPWAQHTYAENGLYVVSATYYGQGCPNGITLNFTLYIDCINTDPCPADIWSGAGESCGVMNFEIGSYVEGEEVTWFPGDETGAVVGGHFFTHTYANPGTYNVCAFYTSPACPNGVELCETIVVESCALECPTQINVNENSCELYSFYIGNGQIGEATWDFGDGTTTSGPVFVDHFYESNGVYVITATFHSANCPEGITLSYTLTIDCIQTVSCPSVIWTGAGDGCGVMNFEIGNFIAGEQVTWFPGDETGAVVGGHFFTHTYAQPGTYNVCAFYTSPACPQGVELCQSIVVANCNSECPSVIYGFNSSCGHYSFNIGNEQLGEALWNFGDGNTTAGPAWAEHTYLENGVYVVTATFYSANCPDGITLNYTINIDCLEVSPCPSYIWSGVGDGCGVMNFEIGSFVGGEAVTWFPGDETGSVNTGHFFSHTYAQPGLYNVCAFYTSPACPNGVELCTTIYVEACNTDPCPTYITAEQVDCNSYVFHVQGVDAGDVNWQFGDEITENSGINADHSYTNDGVYVVSATYTSAACPDGTTLLYTVLVDCSAPSCPEEIWSGAGAECGVMNFEIGSFVEGEAVTWFPGDETGAVNGGHFFTHTYAQPGTYNVCAFYTSPACPNGVELCTTIVVEDCGQTNCMASFLPVITNTLGHIEFTNTSEYTGNATFQWTYGNETGSDGISGNVWYQQNGVFEVCLTVTTATCTDTYCMPVSVQNMETGCAGTEVVITVTGDYNNDFADAINCVVLMEGFTVGNWSMEIAEGFETNINVCVPTGCYQLNLEAANPIAAETITAEIGLNEELINTLQLLPGNVNAEVVFGVNSECAISTQDHEALTFSIYPNPAQHIINVVAASHDQTLQIELYDMTGKLVLDVQSWSNPAQINLENLPVGLYVMRIQGENESSVQRIEIVK